MLRRLCFIGLAVLWVGCSENPTQPAAQDTAIAFVSDRGGKNEIYLIDADGSNPRRLTHNDHEEKFIFASPDGHTLAFLTEEEQLFTIHRDGTHERKLTDASPYPIRNALWASDGKSILYATSGTPVDNPCVDAEAEALLDGGIIDGYPGLFLLNVDDLSIKPLISCAFLSRKTGRLAFSPDGQSIVFYGYQHLYEDNRWKFRGFGIFTLNTDGQNRVPLTQAPPSHFYPSWSPDGKYISFVSADHELYILPARAGSTPAYLVDQVWNRYSPIWSPDGKKIAYIDDHDLQLYYIDIHERTPVQLTLSGLINSPHWAPDSRRIVFHTSIGITSVDIESPLESHLLTWAFEEWPDRFPIWLSRN